MVLLALASKNFFSKWNANKTPSVSRLGHIGMHFSRCALARERMVCLA